MVFHGRDRYVYQSSGPNDDRIDVVLNTDSEDLIQLVSKVKDLNVTVFRRDMDLAGDKVPKVAVILDGLLRAEKQFNVTYDMVVDLDITSPLRTVQDIKNAIDRKWYVRKLMLSIL